MRDQIVKCPFDLRLLPKKILEHVNTHNRHIYRNDACVDGQTANGF